MLLQQMLNNALINLVQRRGMPFEKAILVACLKTEIIPSPALINNAKEIYIKHQAPKHFQSLADDNSNLSRRNS